MRLALITQDFSPKVGGIQTYALELAKRFHSKCEVFCVVAPKAAGASAADASQPFTIKRIKSKEPLLGWTALLNLPSYLKARDIDTVFHTQWTTLPVSVYMKKAGIIKNIYLAVHGRELLFNPFENIPWFGKIYAKFRKKMLSYVDHFFPVSDYTAKLLKEEGIDELLIDVVINGTDPELLYPLNSSELKNELNLKDKKILLTITRLVSRKGVDTVLKALPQIIEKHSDVVYLIAGEGPFERKLKDIVKELELESFVSFLGKISYSDLIKYYNVCDIFVMPSNTELPDVEGFGLVFLEANACGKPVVGSKSGGIPNAIIDEKTGLLVEEQNTGELVAAIRRLLDNPEFANKLGQNGRDRVLKEANWNNTADKILKKIS